VGTRLSHAWVERVASGVYTDSGEIELQETVGNRCDEGVVSTVDLVAEARREGHHLLLVPVARHARGCSVNPNQNSKSKLVRHVLEALEALHPTMDVSIVAVASSAESDGANMTPVLVRPDGIVLRT
jgi:hypothetical protein